MRISTAQMYATNVSTITRQQSDQLQLQQQLSTGKRVISPSDDPVASARSLEVSQAMSLVKSQKDNQGSASDALKNIDSRLGSVDEILTYVKERAIQAGSGALNASDQQAIAVDVLAQARALLAQGNAIDANGEYIFSGYQGDTLPFAGDILSGVTYQGDQGSRAVQVASSRQIPASLNGAEVFGDGFSATASGTNTGTGAISQQALTGSYYNGQYGIKFTSATTFDYYDLSVDPSMTGTPASTGLAYTAGTAINLPPAPATASVQFTVTGAPASGDSFTVQPKSAFAIMDNLYKAMTTLTGKNLSAAISASLGQLDRRQDNVLSLRAQTGSRMVEVDALTSLGEDLNIQYADRENRLVGLDYVSAISDFQLQQNSLQASMNSFLKISDLSLFKYLS